MTEAEKLRELEEIGRYLLDEFNLGGCVYDVRERALDKPDADLYEYSWHHPSVVKFGEMVAKLQALVKP